MTKTIKKTCSDFVLILLIICLVGCNLNYNTKSTKAVTEDQLRSAMPSIIEHQLSSIDEYLEDDVKTQLYGTTRGKSSISGQQIVEGTLNEEKGFDYLNFCYQANNVTSSQETEGFLNAASNLLNEEDYEKLCNKINEVNTQIEESATRFARTLPKSQQKAFYKDLKELVVRTTVLLTAGIVYAIVPAGVFWGKITAAAAISVGAGLTAQIIMTMYERYKFGVEDTKQSFEDWFKEMLKQPKADYAVAASIIAFGQTFEKGPVVAGIVVAVFAVFKLTDAVRVMMLTYNTKS